jgi:hypothetical protein
MPCGELAGGVQRGSALCRSIRPAVVRGLGEGRQRFRYGFVGGELLASSEGGHCGNDPGRIEHDLAPLRSFGTAIIDDVRAMPYPEANTLIDNGYPRGALNYWKSAFLRELSDDAFSVMADCFQRCPSPMSGILLVHYHGAVTRVDPAATAFTHRHPGYSLVMAAQWLDPADTDLNIGWARNTFAALRPHLTERCYVNNLSADDGDAIRNAYGANYERLRAIKRRYDPDNAFRLNHNIDPS